MPGPGGRRKRQVGLEIAKEVLFWLGVSFLILIIGGCFVWMFNLISAGWQGNF